MTPIGSPYATKGNFLPCPFTGNVEEVGGPKGKVKGCPKGGKGVVGGLKSITTGYKN